MRNLTAKWISPTRVAVYRGGLQIADVCSGPAGKGWRVFPLTCARRPSRKLHEFPSDAIRSMYGVRLAIAAPDPEPPALIVNRRTGRAVRQTDAVNDEMAAE